MSERKRIGQLKGARHPIHIEWEIADFLSLTAGQNAIHQSPDFFFCDSAWCIEVFPYGDMVAGVLDCVRVYVLRKDRGPPVTVTYSLFLKKTDGMEELANEVTETFDNDSPLSRAYKGGSLRYRWIEVPQLLLCEMSIRRSEMIQERSKFLPSGVLTVVCSMKCDQTREVRGTETLARDFGGLLASGDESDVTVGVQGREFRLHRAVLAARTPVFSSMFRHDMKEKATGIVTIDDCEAGPFHAFVQYLYTGSTEGLSAENVIGLYRIADKYQVDELKRGCLEYLKRTLSADTFCETLGLALQHEEEDLIEQASEFLNENASDIMDREDWQNLMRSHTVGISLFLKQSFVKNKKFKK